MKRKFNCLLRLCLMIRAACAKIIFVRVLLVPVFLVVSLFGNTVNAEGSSVKRRFVWNEHLWHLRVRQMSSNSCDKVDDNTKVEKHLRSMAQSILGTLTLDEDRLDAKKNTYRSCLDCTVIE